MTGRPLLVVAGRPGTGRSSLVSALAAADAGIGEVPFHTVEPRDWPVPAEGEAGIVLRDLPGLEDAARALALLGPLPALAAEREARLRAFLDATRGDDLREERLALGALREAAGFLHVVDGAFPCRAHHRADARLLAWAGTPGVLVVNVTAGREDHAAGWIEALGASHVAAVRFDPVSAGPAERDALLLAIGAAIPALRGAAEAAVAGLARRAARLRADAAREIARLLVDELTHAEEVEVARGESADAKARALEERFHAWLVAREQRARAELERLHGFPEGTVAATALEAPVWQRDLFAEDWTLLGLTPRQQLLAGAASGLAVGSTVDLATAGATHGAGSLVGGLAGAAMAGANLGRKRMSAHPATLGARLRRAWSAVTESAGTTRFVVGPHTGLNFPWVLLERARLHHAAVAVRSHARRGSSDLPAAQVGRAALDDALVRELSPAFERIRRHHEDAAAQLEPLVPLVERALGSS